MDILHSSKKIFRAFFSNLDYTLLLITFFLCLVGIIFSYSSQILIREEKINLYFKFFKQMIYFGLGIVFIVIMAQLNYKKLAEHSLLLMLPCIILLVLTLIIGTTVNNSKRWINLGLISIQPSEFVKLIIIIFVANYLTKLRENPLNKKYLMLILGIGIIPIFLVLIQPDLGTATISFLIIFVMFSFSIINKKYFIFIIYFIFSLVLTLFLFIYSDIVRSDKKIIQLIFNENYFLFFLVSLLFLAVFLVVINMFIWRNLKIYYFIFFLFITFCGSFLGFFLDEFFLKSYQKERLFAFLDPQLFRWSLGYNIIQSKITIGSGGVLGKGLFNGAQSQLGFLPSRSTDFIFSVIAEELGFVGSVLVVSLFFLLIWRLIYIATKVKDYLGGLIIIGIATFFFLQSMINIGMTMSLFPITGLPLPFISAGGSTLLSSMMAIGLVMSIYRRRNVN